MDIAKSRDPVTGRITDVFLHACEFSDERLLSCLIDALNCPTGCTITMVSEEMEAKFDLGRIMPKERSESSE